MFSSILQKAGFKPRPSMQSSIPRLLIAAALVGGSGSMLSAGSAHAATIDICDFGGYIGGNTACSLSGAGSILDIGDKRVTLKSLPSQGMGTINFQNLVANLFTVRTFFQPALSLPPFSNATFEYDVNIVSGLQTFSGVKLAADAVEDADITETEISVTPHFNPLNIVNSVSPDPASGYAPVTPKGLVGLKIRNVYSVGIDSGLTSFTNTFQQETIPPVPGPLPIMGAGLALGFSRKLRGRIKASAAA